MKKILLKTDQNNPAIKEYKAAMEKGLLHKQLEEILNSHVEDEDDYQFLVINELEALITSREEMVRNEAEQKQKANLEQAMAYLFRKISNSHTMRLGENRKNWLWGSMCEWINEYITELKAGGNK